MELLNYMLRFIEEDAPSGDITSSSVIPDISCNAIMRAEQGGIIAGLSEVSTLCSHFGITVKQGAKDGDRVSKNDMVLLLSGDAKKILLVERTALNIIGRMSSIATQTRTMADIVSSVNPHCRVAATRKTCPGFQIFDKKAVQIGGGDPHRMNLSDGILIKDNHLALVPLRSAIRAVKNLSMFKKIEVEVESSDDAVIAATAGADIIMLDNMTPDQVAQTIELLKREGMRDRILIELSGGINENSIINYASLDVDAISLGFLTHSVSNFSVNLEIVPKNNQ
jgi:nicotinate-nucleotide pyrophosphorylase (carboxylating)